MKNFSMLIPVVLMVLFGVFGSKLMASSAVNPTTMIPLGIGALVVMVLFRPKKQTGTPASDSTLSLLDDFAKDAFADDEDLNKQFHSAVSDYVKGMSRAASKKLEKLQSQCKSDADTYAVNVTLGLIKSSFGDYAAAIELFDKAVVLHPTTELAHMIGTSYQRIGELDKARDSYEFAIDLDHSNIDAHSSLATAYVADGMLDEAIEAALSALEMDSSHASSLATCAICYGILNDALLCKHYTDKAVANGYNADKISGTITALKKKFKR